MIGYAHTQRSPLWLLLLLPGLAILVGAWFAEPPAVQMALVAGGALMSLAAGSFERLEVRDEGNYLTLAFGPLPLFRRSVDYAQIECVERGRTSLIDGWGIHYLPGRGVVWNLWGFDCVDIYFTNGRKLRIGTDDPAGLERFLRHRSQQF